MIESPPQPKSVAAPPVPESQSTSQPASKQGRSVGARLLTILSSLLKYAFGVLFCQRMLGAMLVVGWTNRLLRRSILRSWWKQLGPRDDGLLFEDYCSAAPITVAASRYPNWILAEPPLPGGRATLIDRAGRSRFRAGLRRGFGSLGANAREGFLSIFNLLVATLPATGLWIYSWVLGWNISFFKLYEQSALGVSLGFSGIALFIVAMLYVPTAHARQAVTGDWKSFYDFRLNWRIAAAAPIRRIAAIVIVSTASFLLLAERVIRYHIGSSPEIAALSDAELIEWLDGYFLAISAVLLPLYVAVWRMAGRAYAKGAQAEFARDRGREEWRPVERYALGALPAAVRRPGVVAQVGRATSRLSRWGMTAAACLGWFIVAGEVYVMQFFNYVPVTGWLNHPLLILPWIRFIPV